jgi:hypothetical protein
MEGLTRPALNFHGDTTMSTRIALEQNARPAAGAQIVRAETGHAAATRREALWGRILSGLSIAFLLFDTGMKIAGVPAAVDGTAQLGYLVGTVFGIGLVELACLALYALPRTAVLGALLLTGYLGGAVATHVRVENPLLSHVLFPTYVAALVWGGLYLREPRLRTLLPLRR